MKNAKGCDKEELKEIEKVASLLYDYILSYANQY